jgi:hypothetical protein
MDYAKQFASLVKITGRKNQASLPALTQKEIEAECWCAVAAAIHRWDGSKGKLYSWVYTAVTGRIKDLRKRPTIITTSIEDCSEFPEMENDNYMEDDDHALYF